MKLFAVLCLAAMAVARPQDYKSGVTTVTERSFTIRGDADKYYGSGYTGYNGGYSGGYSGYAGGYNGYAGGYNGYAAQPYSYSTVASAVPVAQQAYQAYSYQAAAPAYHAYHSAPVAYTAATAAPAVAYQAVTAAPAVAYQAVTAAPAVAYQAAPAVAYQAAPAVAYHQAATVAPAVSYAANYGLRSDYDASYGQHVSGADTKIYKHVYAFAAPEEPATRAAVRVEAPVSKRKHYKLIFIKAPNQQTVVDSDITLPAQEEEKTLIYVLSKNQKQIQPEIRIKQAEASKHAKPEVFFLKYKNEAEAQAIASGAISGQTANVPAQGEIISDGSVSALGQSSSFGSGAYESGSFDNSFRASVPASAPILYRTGSSAGLSAVSAGTVGIVPSAAVVSAPVTTVVSAPVAPVGLLQDSSASSYSFGSGAGAGLSGGFSAYGRSFNDNQEPASVAIKVTSEPTDILEPTTASTLQL